MYHGNWKEFHARRLVWERNNNGRRQEVCISYCADLYRVLDSSAHFNRAERLGDVISSFQLLVQWYKPVFSTLKPTGDMIFALCDTCNPFLWTEHQHLFLFKLKMILFVANKSCKRINLALAMVNTEILSLLMLFNYVGVVYVWMCASMCMCLWRTIIMCVCVCVCV